MSNINDRTEESILMEYQQNLSIAKGLLAGSNPLFKVSSNGLRRVLLGVLSSGVEGDPKFQTKQEHALYTAFVRGMDAKYTLISKILENEQNQIEAEAKQLEENAALVDAAKDTNTQETKENT